MMKLYILLIAFILLINSEMHAQYFKVQELKASNNKFLFAQDTPVSYKIVAFNDSSEFNSITYPIKLQGQSSTDSDTLAMIEELFKFEGDTRLCCFPINNYNPLISQIYIGSLKRYSLQVEALFLINQLFFDKPFNYSPYPLLYDNVNKTYASTNENLISIAYNYYKKWYQEVKRLGLRKAKSENLNPLEGASIKWYP